jgi:glutamate racemase
MRHQALKIAEQEQRKNSFSFKVGLMDSFSGQLVYLLEMMKSKKFSNQLRKLCENNDIDGNIDLDFTLYVDASDLNKWISPKKQDQIEATRSLYKYAMSQDPDLLIKACNTMCVASQAKDEETKSSIVEDHDEYQRLEELKREFSGQNNKSNITFMYDIMKRSAKRIYDKSRNWLAENTSLRGNENDNYNSNVVKYESPKKDLLPVVIFATPQTIASGLYQNIIEDLHKKKDGSEKLVLISEGVNWAEELNINPVVEWKEEWNNQNHNKSNWPEIIKELDNDAKKVVSDLIKELGPAKLCKMEKIAVGMLCTHFPLVKKPLQELFQRQLKSQLNDIIAKDDNGLSEEDQNIIREALEKEGKILKFKVISQGPDVLKKLRSSLNDAVNSYKERQDISSPFYTNGHRLEQNIKNHRGGREVNININIEGFFNKELTPDAFKKILKSKFGNKALEKLEKLKEDIPELKININYKELDKPLSEIPKLSVVRE